MKARSQEIETCAPEAFVGETIVAIATPPGQGGIGIVRLSGPLVAAITEAVTGRIPEPRHACLSTFRQSDTDTIDHGLVLFFPAPYSYTGEDIVEFQGHGGPVVLDRLLRRCLELGARLAKPGEFSQRAFLNGKLDLAQAEAVADLIASQSQAAAKSAMLSLKGVFSSKIGEIADKITDIRIFVEAAIDFPEEEIDFLKDSDVSKRLLQLDQKLRQMITTCRQGRLLREGLNVVLAGAPNAGKSSLINALTGEDRIIVSPQAGTTRDVIDVNLVLDGLPVNISDTAGLRHSNDAVETEGVKRAQQAVKRADLVLLVVDDSDHDNKFHSQTLIAQQLPDTEYTIVRNKIDLTGRPAGQTSAATGDTVLSVSAKSGAGLEVLRQYVKKMAGYRGDEETVFIARRRHVDALTRANDFISQGIRQLELGQAPELLAEDLRAAHQVLGEITGEVSSDELLGKIFSSFCIGK